MEPKTSEIEQLLQRMVERTVAIHLTQRVRPSVVQILVKLNRLAGLLGDSGKKARRGGEQAESMVSDFGELLSRSSSRNGYSEYVSAMMIDLNRLAAITGMWSAPKAQPLGKRLQADFKITYSVDRLSGEGELVEQRENRRGFNIPHSDYQAAIKALSQAIGTPMKFNHLHTIFLDRGGNDVASMYPLRIILRFWQLSQPPLVMKELAKYTPLAENAEEFQRQAVQAWDKLPVKG